MLTKADYQSAIEVQNACNASGVIGSLAKLTSKIWDEARELNKGTDYVNTHPIVKMYLCKLTDLAGIGVWDQEAYQTCLDFINKPE